MLSHFFRRVPALKHYWVINTHGSNVRFLNMDVCAPTIVSPILCQSLGM